MRLKQIHKSPLNQIIKVKCKLKLNQKAKMKKTNMMKVMKMNKNTLTIPLMPVIGMTMKIRVLIHQDKLIRKIIIRLIKVINGNFMVIGMTEMIIHGTKKTLMIGKLYPVNKVIEDTKWENLTMENHTDKESIKNKKRPKWKKRKLLKPKKKC